jgi:hypothetical protein
MTLEQIKAAVREGRKVYWSNARYTVTLSIGRRTGEERWLIVSDAGRAGANAIGLTWADGVTMNGKPEEFYIGD